MSKFKVGDTVEYVGTLYPSLSKYCVIVSPLPMDKYNVEDDKGTIWYLDKEEIEMLNQCHCESCEYNGPCEEPIEVNEQGGKGSFTGTRMDLIPAKALLEVGKVMYEGSQKYSEDNWRQVEVKSHINHALKHLFNHLGGLDEMGKELLTPKGKEVELAHATTRLLMALELIKE